MSELSVMTFNIRYADAPDGENAWAFRRDAVIKLLAEQQPALLGLQEATGSQIDLIRERFPEYGFTGRGHLTGSYAEEHAAILYDKRVLCRLHYGTFWYADTLEKPGSVDWGNSIPRTCSWAQFRFQDNESSFRVYNLHWDHEQESVREKSAQLLLKQILLHASNAEPTIVLGDFNCGESAPSFRRLLSAADLPLQDSFRVIHPAAQHVGSFHQFTGSTSGDKIDAILISPEWQVSSAKIIDRRYKGRYPSDHFPICATLFLSAHSTRP